MTKTILVVDDYPDALELMVALISRAGYKVLKAEGAFPALEILNETPPDAVVLDLMMPDRSGIELLENIRWDAKLSHIPVICVSAVSLTGEALKFIQEFSAGLIDKAEISKVVVALEKALAGR